MSVSPASRLILLLESDPRLRQQVARILTAAGYRVEAHAGTEALPRRSPPAHHDLVLAALDWKDRESRARIRRLKKRTSDAPVVIMCPKARIAGGVSAMQHGAEDYLVRPPDPAELEIRLQRIFDRRELDSRIVFYQNELSKKAVHRRLEARSPAMSSMLDKLRRVAPRRSTVLILGESGVGKELVARSIHFNSPRRDRPFIALNCAAMPANLIESDLFGHERGSFTGAHARTRGKFEIAHKGTLFLDEIGEMDPATQAKLLRVLEEREFMRLGGDRSIQVDVRVIAATNADLEQLVAGGAFRSDLYYRLKVVSLRVPPLRERREDIPDLVHTFLDELARSNAVPTKRITADVVAALENYNWPGNVRELKNLLESVLVSVPGDVIRPEDLPQAVHKQPARRRGHEFVPGTTLEQMERELIRQTLEHTGGNRTHSAAMLGIGVRTLQRKIRSYEIDIASTRRRRRRA